MNRLAYYRRVLAAYGGRGRSHLSFWHETPALEPGSFDDPPGGRYYMTFAEKARYAGPFDAEGIPLLDYRGRLGPQYNPIAIAQYGLARWNRFCQTGSNEDRAVALRMGEWLVRQQEEGVWWHRFDWDYFRPLRAPWRSGLAQGQGLSLLARLYAHTGEARFSDAAEAAWRRLAAPVEKGGCVFVETDGTRWIEEYITDPPTHILNGMIWALWGVWDWHRVRPTPELRQLWEEGVGTLRRNLPRYDLGYWSCYDLAPLPIPNPASPFYHRLHIVQGLVLARLSGDPFFETMARRWHAYTGRAFHRGRAFLLKCLFKAFYY
jgi:heparosan-N-sulfate-glucuronate 5-epimerase